ncbi:MAG: delta-60 repeat domain-containing protein [Verrucomicrobia bacterium]|nr:delta-60 repeat domain-containing protein [Verrucomicrobiota bacterium]
MHFFAGDTLLLRRLLAVALGLQILALSADFARAQQAPAAVRDGGIDTEFLQRVGQGAGDRIHCAALAADGSGKVLLAGWFTTYAGQERWRIARIFPDGRLDAAFDPGDGPGTEPILALLPLPDGGCLVAGAFRRFAEKPRRLLARLRADGSLDETFDATNALLTAAPPATRGRSRRHADATAETDQIHGPSPAPVDGLRALALLPADKDAEMSAHPLRVLVGGEFADGAGHLLCLDAATGAAVPGFHPPAIPAGGAITAILPLPDGKILIGGRFESVAGQPRAHVAWLAADGTLDLAFDPGLGADGAVLCLALSPVGNKPIVGGEFTHFAGQARAGLARLENDGRLDATFDPELAGAGSRSVETLVPVATGDALLVGGKFLTIRNRPLGGIVRLDARGRWDTSFDPGAGAANFVSDDVEDEDDPATVHAIVPLPAAGGEENGLLVAGRFDLFNAVPAHNLVRLRVGGR